MKRALAVVMLACVLALPIAAGDTNGPPLPLPPPCTENCPQSATTTQSPMNAILQAVIEMLLKLRP